MTGHSRVSDNTKTEMVTLTVMMVMVGSDYYCSCKRELLVNGSFFPLITTVAIHKLNYRVKKTERLSQCDYSG